MEGENLYKTSSEKKFLRKVAGDKDAPDVVSHSAQEDLARIKDDLSGLIGKEGGLQKTKERFLKDKGEAERQVQTGSLDLEGAVDSMKEEGDVFRQIMSLGDDLLNLRNFEMRERLAKKTDPHALKAHERLSQTTQKERKSLEEKLATLEKDSPRACRGAELIRYRQDLSHEGHIALAPSVEKNLSRIGDNMTLGKPMLLHGPTGSGKTSLARFAAVRFTSQSPEMVYCNPQTRESSVWGKTGIRPAKEGHGAMETVDIYGPLAKAATEGKAVIFDEFTALPQEQQVFIKGIFNAKVGDEINIVGNGRNRIAPGFQMIMTANLKSEKNPERQAMPPEIAREFEQNNLKIGYPPKHETYDIMLARLLNPDGSSDISWYDLNETLPRFCEAMEEIQTAYQGEMTETSARLTATAGLSSKAKGLQKFVLTPGTVEAILEDWKRKREEGGTTLPTLAEHLDERLKISLTFEEYSLEDRTLAAKILSAKGFLRTLTAEELNLPKDVFAFDAARRLRGDETARIEMLKKLKEESGRVKHLSLKELSDLDPFGVQTKTKERRLAALRGMLPKTDTPTGFETHEAGHTSLERAREILKDRLLGPEEVERVFGINIEKIPPIPFPEDKLEQLKDSCHLILYADRWDDATPLTCKSIAEKFNNKKADGTKLLHDTNWYEHENFFNTEPPSLKWRLVGDEAIPDSTSKNYLDQTKLLSDFVENQYKNDPSTIPADIKEMIEEARTLANDPDFQAKVRSGDLNLWKPATEKLSTLPLNRSFRESFPELIYRLILLDRAKAIQLLQNMYSWTNSCSSDGSLVVGGVFDADGAGVAGSVPGDAYSSIGLFLSAEKF